MLHTEDNLFREAALNPDITALGLLDLNAKHSPNHPLFIFELNGVIQKLTWKEVVDAICFSAHLVTQSVKDVERDEGARPVIGILASSDSITHYTMSFGILRAGCPTFLISTRNSPAAIAHLLLDTKCHHVFVSKDTAMQNLCSTAATILANRSHNISVHRMPLYTDIYASRSTVQTGATPQISTEDLDNPAFVLHSSGSTSLPKPVYVSHRVLMQWIRHPLLADGDLSHDTMAIHALPMHHGMGLLMTSWASSTGMSISCFPPVSPPIQPSPDTVLRNLIATNSTLVFCVPSFLEHWAENPETITLLSRLRAVSFAGAPLNQAVGDLLAERKVPMVHIYGSTEIGCGTVFMPKKPQGEDWNYLSFSPQLNFLLVPHGEEGLHELVFLEGQHRRPCVFNTFINGERAYATNDLLIQHPNNLMLWKLHGRKDDQLVLSTGEKTNPGPVEKMLCGDPLIAHAIMFGRGREQTGVIVQPRPEHVFDMDDSNSLASFRNQIWPTVSKANATVPSHSRLFKEMILVTHPSKLFDLTAKGTPRRGFVLESYKKEIEQAYQGVRDAPPNDIPVPTNWDSSQVSEFVRSIIHWALPGMFGDDADLFERGCDSLQATWIRNAIVYALGQSPYASAADISANLVYENPSISALANYIASLVSPRSFLSRTIPRESKLEMQALVDALSRDFPTHRPSEAKQTGDVILLTGSTGSLGSHILAQLVALPEVSCVFAINRRVRNGASLYDRQLSSLEDRGLDTSLLASPKIVLLEADLTLPGLGLTEPSLEKIQNSITHIVHNAWRVDFKMSLMSFKSLVYGTRNLVDLALRSPLPSLPAFIFISSSSVLRNWESPGLVPEVPVNAEVAVGFGYSESKWVTETILHAASRLTALCPTIVRLDQLSGSSNGSWNQTDSIPAIVRSGQVLGCVPDRLENIAWLPVDIAAASIIETRGSKVPFLHLRNPHPVPWHQLFGWISVQLKIELVPYAQWLSRLAAKNIGDAGEVRNNPAVLLVDFFKSMSEDKGLGMPYMDISNSLQRCESLESAKLRTALSEGEVKRWISYWKRKRLLDD